MERAGEESASASAEIERTCARRSVPAGVGFEWLESFARLSPVAIFRVDAEGRCTYVNERWVQLSGYPMEAALGDEWQRAVHPEDVPRIQREWQEAVRQGTPYRTEVRYVQPGGKIVWVLAETVEHRDAHGSLLGYISTVTDISELRCVREELQRTRELLEQRVRERTALCEQMALTMAASGDAIMTADLSGKIVNWNAAAETIFGYSAAEMIGRTTFAVTPADRLGEAEALKARVRGGERVDCLETVRVARSGELIEVALSLFPLRNADGVIVGMSGIARDIRGQKKAERRLHQISGRLLRLQDEERRRFARELHDSTAQSVAALALNLSLLHHQGADLPEERRAELVADCLTLAEGVGRELSTHAYLLHPPLLDERGLGAALRWLVSGFAKRSGLAVEIEIDPRVGRLPAALELTIFRVVQESLTNVHRHAKSPTAGVGLRVEDDAIVVEVRDAGCGLPREGEDCIGVGIAGMRERLAQIGGALTIESSSAGTHIIGRIPKS